MALIDEMEKGIVYVYVYKVYTKKKETELLACTYRNKDIGIDSCNLLSLMEDTLRSAGGRYMLEYRLREEIPAGEAGGVRWTTVRAVLMQKARRMEVERALTEKEVYQKW